MNAFTTILGIALLAGSAAFPNPDGDAAAEKGTGSAIAAVGSAPTRTPKPTNTPKPTSSHSPTSTPESTHTATATNTPNASPSPSPEVSLGDRDHSVLPAPKGSLGRIVLRYNLEDSLDQAEFDVVVQDVDRKDKVGDKEAIGEYVVVRLEITNMGKTPEQLPFGDGSNLIRFDGTKFNAIRLGDSQERTFNHDYSATMELWYDDEVKTTTIDELQPGITYEFKLVFDVPRSASGLRVYVGWDNSVAIPD